MPRFIFRLEPVLGFRQRLEDAQQVIFAAALSTLRSAEAQRDDYIARRSDMQARIVKHHGEMDAVELRATYAHCDFLDRSIVAQGRVIDEARTKADQERVKLVAKTRDKKVLEVLKERRRETFESEAGAAEQRESDELNARRFERVTITGEYPS